MDEKQLNAAPVSTQKGLNVLGLMSSGVDESFVICPMCTERYTRPKMLKCLHTFCEHCITVHIQHAARNKQVTHKDFPCPRCAARTAVVKPELPLDKWSDTLPANTMMEALLESISMQVDERLCGTCEEGGDTSRASYWCRDCAEPLCDACLRYHRLMKVSRRHKIEEMDTVRRHPRTILSVPQPCPDHVGKDIELFCADHNTLCCVMCVATEHRRCEKVASIEKLSKQLEEGAVTEELVDKLNSYLDHVTSVKLDRQTGIHALASKKTEILERVANYKENVNILLEKLEASITEQFERIHEEQTVRLKSEVDWCSAMQSAVDNAKTVLLVTNRHCSNAQVFITVQQVIERSIQYEDDLAKEQRDRFEKIEYSFEIDSAFEAFLQSLISVESFGKVHVHRRRACLEAPPGVKMLRDRTAEKVVEFDAKTPTDVRNCCLSAVLFLSDERLLVCDQNNQKVKVFTRAGQLLHEQAFSTWPRDVAELPDNRVAVTLPKERKVELYYLGDKLRSLETLRLQDECWGITFSRDHLIIGCIRQDRGCLKFLTPDGIEVDSIEDDLAGRRLFIKTNYVTTNVEGDEIYVTDRTKDTLVALAMKNQLFKQPPPAEDQGPRRLIPIKAKPRSSTVLGHGPDQSGTQSDRRARSEIARPLDPTADTSFRKTYGARDKLGSPIEEAFVEKSEAPYNVGGTPRTTPHRDARNVSTDELASVRTDEIEGIGKNSPIEREDTRSVNSDTAQYENTDKAEYDVMYSYSNEILKSAGGVAVDHQGNIYVSGYRSSNIHQVSPGGSLIKILLHNLSQPLAVSVEPYGEQIAITETSSSKQNMVQIFKLE